MMNSRPKGISVTGVQNFRWMLIWLEYR